MGKERLTITLSPNVLKQVNNLIDGTKIRNRSHAIEYVISKNFLPQETKVLILAGGKGLKMRPLTYEVPKAMIPIHQKPLLEYTINLLKKNNLEDVIISTGYLGEKIINHFEDGKKFGINIDYILQNNYEKGTAGPILQAEKKFSHSSFLVFYSDVLADIDLIEFIDFHNSHGGIATVAVTTVADPSGWGVVDLRGNKVVGFSEKPKTGKSLSHVISAGIYIFNPQIFKFINKECKSLEREVFPKLVKAEGLFGYSFDGQWFDVGTPKEYERAIKEWKK